MASVNTGTLFQLGPDGIGYIRDTEDGKSRGFDLSLLATPVSIDQFLAAEGRQVRYQMTGGRVTAISWPASKAAAAGA